MLHQTFSLQPYSLSDELTRLCVCVHKYLMSVCVLLKNAASLMVQSLQQTLPSFAPQNRNLDFVSVWLTCVCSTGISHSAFPLMHRFHKDTIPVCQTDELWQIPFKEWQLCSSSAPGPPAVNRYFRAGRRLILGVSCVDLFFAECRGVRAPDLIDFCRVGIKKGAGSQTGPCEVSENVLLMRSEALSFLWNSQHTFPLRVTVEGDARPLLLQVTDSASVSRGH